MTAFTESVVEEAARGVTTSTRTSCGVALFLGACAALAALAAQPAAAQQPLLTQPLDSGAVVRLRLRDGAREGAKLLTRFGPGFDTLSYCRWPALPCTPGSERHVVRPATAVLGIETYRGSGAKLGAIIGAIVGVPMGFVVVELVEYSEERDPGTARSVRLVAQSSVGWALFGAMIGLFFQRWGPAP